ncbi:Flp family type IVb pilin [Rhodovulum sp. YNF3179]|uniref:Flp family type IVb pilin n=1 Tax=Rhodovulum sp. YNF3179 TaxID=3425127 RepID=UPI003D346807
MTEGLLRRTLYTYKLSLSEGLNLRLNILHRARGFFRDDDGLALTEYVVLLGVLTAIVVIAVQAFGVSVADVWVAWASWISDIPTPT